MKTIESRRNLCQSCFKKKGRYILDCFCIICEKCFGNQLMKNQFCRFCGKQTKGNKIDAKNKGNLEKISHLFENVQLKVAKINQVMKFQNQASNRYVQHLQSDLNQYKKAVSQLVQSNPKLFEYFSKRIKFTEEQQDTFKRNFSTKGSTTVKNQITKRQYSSIDVSNSRNSVRSETINEEMYGIKKIKKKKKVNNMSGNFMNKVGNLNYMTAIQNSQKSVRNNDQKLKLNSKKQNEVLKYYKGK